MIYAPIAFSLAENLAVLAFYAIILAAIVAPVLWRAWHAPADPPAPVANTADADTRPAIPAAAAPGPRVVTCPACWAYIVATQDPGMFVFDPHGLCGHHRRMERLLSESSPRYAILGV
jgi:hypothetical protein